MSVIPITIFFSLLLAGTFVLLFAREQLRRSFSSAERDSLLPLAEETAREVRTGEAERGLPPSPNLWRTGWTRSERVKALRSTSESDHDHADGDACGCRRGVRTPCAGCLNRLDVQDPAYF